LSYNVTEEDFNEWLKGQKLRTNKVHLLKEADGKSKGTGFIDFFSA
jgi:hypothetical protein